MYKREIKPDILRRLGGSPAVAILGPRQVGKTTLALEIAGERPSTYLDLENPEDLQKLEDPAHYLGTQAGKLVVIDEVQRIPDLFMPLRGIIDAWRREGRGNGRLLVLGPASDKLLRQTSESLAGRIHYAELAGLGPFEIEAPEGAPLQRLWMRGGFPDSYAAADDRRSHEWRGDLVRTYLERDIPQLGPRIPAATLMRFWTMLAHGQGELLNASRLASALGASSVTVARYLDMMVDLMLVRRLVPWHGNIGKRLVKSPKVYIRDSGILHALLRITDYDTLLGHPVLGRSWEGFVVERVAAALPHDVQPCFYRTAAGAEVDLVLEFGTGDRWAVEIKSGRAPTLSKGFHTACADLEATAKLAVYTGEEEYRTGDGTRVMPLGSFLRELAARAGR